MALNNKNRVVVLKGGPSEERAVSLVSGSQCGAALSSAGYDVIELDVNKDVVTNLKELEPDVVFNALHGRWGEDGCILGIFCLLYTSPSPRD